MFKKMLLGFTCVAALSLPAFANEITIPTARGNVSFNKTPAKIAVFDTGSLDTLQALGVKVDGAPVDAKKVLGYLAPTFDHATDVGTLFEPNLEALNRLKPELIIVGIRSAKKYDDVKAIAPTIDMTNKADHITSGLQAIESFGKLFNKEAKATELKNELQTLVAQTQTAIKNHANKKGLILVVNGGKISAVGVNSRFGWIHETLGVTPAVNDLANTGHGQPVGYEFVQQANPDWLFVLDRIAAIGQEGKSAKEVLDNALVRQTTAWKNGNVVYLSGAAYLAPSGYSQMKTDLTAIKAAFEKK